MRSLFHIKCLFDLNEYLIYDFYNFYAARTKTKSQSPKKENLSVFVPTKLNFFYYIRRSIKIFRLHTLRAFKASFNTERKTNLFFKSFWKMSSMSYMWFFEFNISIFLVKAGFFESLFSSIKELNSNVVSLNGCFDLKQWIVIKPGDSIILAYSLFYILKIKQRLLDYFSIVKRFKKFFLKHALKRKIIFKSDRLFKKAKKVNMTKQVNLNYIETDWRIMRALLLPVKNNSVYYAYIFLKWLNYWNYKTVLWKYDT